MIIKPIRLYKKSMLCKMLSLRNENYKEDGCLLHLAILHIGYTCTYLLRLDTISTHDLQNYKKVLNEAKSTPCDDK